MRKRFLFVCVAVLMFARAAAADSFVIISPSVVALDFEGHEFAFFGADFSIRQDIQSSIGLIYTANGLDPGCDPCFVGQTWDPSFSNTEVFLGTGPADFGGVSYDSLSYFSTLNFVATPATFTATDPSGFYMTTPFTFNGTLRAMDGAQLAFGGTFVGTGTALRFFDPFDEAGKFGAGENTLVFEFGDSATATPEPASLLLVATGIAGFVARRRYAGR
jgi:hypothetical protein